MEDQRRSADRRRRRVFDPLGIVERERSDQDRLSAADVGELTDYNPIAFGAVLSVRQLWRRWRRRRGGDR